jgi:hypothetical protein
MPNVNSDGCQKTVAAPRPRSTEFDLRRVFYAVIAVAACSFLDVSLFAQPSIDLAPPPLKLVSKDERSKLDLHNDVKARTKLAVEMMTLRLSSAEKFVAAGDFESCYRELGAFHALMDDTISFLANQDGSKGKVLDNFKRLEISLRSFAPRLENLRREAPFKYEDYLRRLIISLRETRGKAADSLFADSVVPNRP